MKIVIVGPGAIGLLFAGLLSRSKEEVWLLDHDQERARYLKKHGLKIEGLTSLKIPAPKIILEPKEAADADFWIICVKSYDTKNAAKTMAAAVSAKASVLSLQNGVGNSEILTEALGPERVFAGVTQMGATLLEPGVLRHAGEGETIIGRYDGALSVELKQLREVFQKARIPVKLSRDVAAVLWSKLAVNAGINPLSAITRLRNGGLLKSEGARRILRAAVSEAAKVAKRKKIKLIYDDILAKAESVCEATAENVSSMLQDVLRQKQTEIDFINGAVVRHGENLGIKTPVNAWLLDLIKAIEGNYGHEVSAETQKC